MVTLIIIFILILANSDAREECQEGVIKERIVTPDERDYIVYVHNYYRAWAAKGKIPGQPKAANMQPMTWDPALAASAQKIAETCVFEHVRVKDGRFEVGQNLYTWSSTAYVSGFSWLSAIKSWFDEYATYSFGNTVYNHYTQIVWSTSNLIGCGSTHFKRYDGWYQKLYVCNYGPAGNVVGEQPYVAHYDKTKQVQGLNTSRVKYNKQPFPYQ